MKKFIHWACFLLLVGGMSSFVYNPIKKLVIAGPELKLPAGFDATIVADSLGPLRRLVVTQTGAIYAKLNSLKNGKGIYYLTDGNHDGLMDTKISFGDYPGTGIKIHGNYLYSASNSAVYRYLLNAKQEVVHPEQPEIIVQGLIDRRQDNSKSIALDDQGNLFVTVGSYSDACRQKGSGAGIPGCPILDSAGGIWEFKANKLNQTYGDGIHYARGIKNAVGIDWNTATKTLFATHHGRGSFSDKFPQYYTTQQNSLLPAETVYEVTQGADAGWPFVYYDHIQHQKMLAPEYGGDGKTSVTDKYLNPIVAFPAHLAPNDLLFYTGSQFPARYKNGAFIALHGQSPELKNGYLVAFVPFKNGKPSGNWEIFAELAGEDLAKPTGPIRYRPAGLAQGPDGSLYIADDLKGTIFRVRYIGRN